MVKIITTENEFIFEVKGLHKIWSLKSNVKIAKKI